MTKHRFVSIDNRRYRKSLGHLEATGRWISWNGRNGLVLGYAKVVWRKSECLGYEERYIPWIIEKD